MHTTGLRLFFYTVAEKFGLVSQEDVEAARADHMAQYDAPAPQCDSYRDVYTEGRGSWRECIANPNYSPRASLWK
jgi:hypothetical protein